MHNTKFIFYLTILLLNIKCIQAQNITGTWEGLLSSEYLIINIIQENEQLCGYTYDVELNNHKSFCKSYFKGVYDKKSGIWTISGHHFLENSGDHILMTLKLWYGVENKNKILKGIVSTDSDFLNNFGLGKKEYFWVRKISNIPTNLPNKKTICYEGDIPKNKKTIRQNSPKSTTALPTPKSPLITNPTSEKTIVLPITESTFQQEKLLETPHETLKDTLKLKEVVARKNLLISKIIVTDPTIELKLYDNGIVDNDSVTILYNGNIIATHQKLSEIPVTINLTLDKEKSKHEIILFAENLGTMPPNTALIIINTNGKRYELRSSANMEENAVLYFDYKPK